jgi:hypothetical protein
MASSTISTTPVGNSNVAIRFKKKVKREYVRGGRFGPYIGNDQNKIFQTVQETKKCSLPLVAKVSGAGVRGSTQLSGSEQPLSNFAYILQPTYIRQGVLIDNEEREKSEFDLFREARPALMNWMMESKRDQMIQALGAVEAGGTYYNYGGVAASGATGSSAASAANMDTWQAANTDRILYGKAKSNLTSGDHTTSLATIDTTNDKLTTGQLELMKRMAQDCEPLIRPIMVKEDEPWYVFWAGKYAFRDLQNDSTMSQTNREARARNLDNPLFAGGDLVWNGIIIKELPDLDKFIDSTGSDLWDGVWGANATGDSLATGGDTSSRVSIGFLTGAQAVGFGIGRTASFKRRKEDDYEHLNGVAVSAKHDIKKTFYNTKQHGMLTSFHSASVDT